MPWRSDYTAKLHTEHTHNLKFFGAHKSKISQQAAAAKEHTIARREREERREEQHYEHYWLHSTGVDPVPGNACVQSCLVKNLNWTHNGLPSVPSAANWELRTEKMCKVELNKGAVRAIEGA